jgi:DNA-binding NarL/FixJ family response regulator
VTLQRPIRVVLGIGDCALRADIADACAGAGIAVVASRLSSLPSPPLPASLTLAHLPGRDGWDQGEGREEADCDVVLTDRPIETAVPAIGLVSGERLRVWPANVRAVVPADVDAATLAAIITVVAAGYALTSPPSPAPSLTHKRGMEEWGTGAGKGSGTGEDPSPFADPGDVADESANALSLREREVLALLAEGASNKEIARALALSIHTVKFHVAALAEKLGARSRGEAVAIAIRAGLVMV